MRRFHLFEFEDMCWFPSSFRNYVTDFLRLMAEKFGMFDPVVPHLIDLANKNNHSMIIDMATGAGGQWRTLIPKIVEQNEEIKLTLTDKFPNGDALKDIKELYPDIVTIEERSIDVIDVPPNLHGVRTMFLSIHHFRPKEVKAIFENVINSGSPIAIFEAQRRDAEHIVRFALSPIAVLLMTPFIRPFSIYRLVFTYLIPLIPLIVFWDGVVSVLRTYNNKELEEIAESVDIGDKFEWVSESLLKGQQKIEVFIGYPRSNIL